MQGAQLLLGASGAPEQPAGDRDALEGSAERAEAVGIADPALRAGRLDRPPAALGAGDGAHGMALLSGIPRQL